jgi:hypothetical protein
VVKDDLSGANINIKTQEFYFFNRCVFPCNEGGIRVPFIAYQGGITKAGIVNTMPFASFI